MSSQSQLNEPEVEPNGKVHTVVTLTAIILPFLAFLLAIVLLWNKLISLRDLAMLIGFHVLAALGVTVGFHRLLTHRSFETTWWIRTALVIMASFSIEGQPVAWVADHRRHHTHADEDGDPHSPHAGRRRGVWGALGGFNHAHWGWLITEGSSNPTRYAPDLLRDPVVMAINRLFPLFIGLALLIPAGLGYALSGGEVMAALTGLLWGGAVRIFLTHHVTWSINSICHMVGSRPFRTTDRSTNVGVLSLLTMGESWHHNHHAFPTSAFHGLEKRQRWLDPSGWVIWTLERLGLAWDVKRVSVEKMEAKRVQASV